MPIIFKCDCGKPLQMVDALAGKSVKCPSCGDMVYVPIAPQASGKPAKASASPAVYISAGKIMAMIALAIIIALGATFYYGPVRVWHQWEDMGSKASDDVQQVITFAMQAYLSQHGGYDPSDPHSHAGVESGDIMFYRPGFVMSMPAKVEFKGKSNQGDFSGTYDTRTGEVDATIGYGGISIAGMVDLAKAEGSFHATGKVVNGKVEAESDGKKLQVVERKPIFRQRP